MCLGYFSPLCNWSLFHKKLPDLSRIPVLDLPATVVVSLFGSKVFAPEICKCLWSALSLSLSVCVCVFKGLGKNINRSGKKKIF